MARDFVLISENPGKLCGFGMKRKKMMEFVLMCSISLGHTLGGDKWHRRFKSCRRAEDMVQWPKSFFIKLRA